LSLKGITLSGEEFQTGIQLESTRVFYLPPAE